MTEDQRNQLIFYLRTGMTPLEASQAIRLSWHEVKSFCEKHGLKPSKAFEIPGYYKIAVNIRKATIEDAYGPCRCHTS